MNFSKKVIVVFTVIITIISITISSKQFRLDGAEITADSLSQHLNIEEEYQDYIVLDQDQIDSLKGVAVSHVESREDMSVINSSIRGGYSVYKIKGHFVFCIEPGASTLSVATVSSPSGSKFGKFANSSKIYLEQVTSSAIYHYNQTANVDYIFAGQLLIWDYLSSHEADVIGNPFGAYKPDFLTSWTIHESKAYGAEINRIEEDVEQWYTIPSFAGSTTTEAPVATLKYDPSTKMFSTVLTDSNEVWDQRYATYGEVGNYQLSNPSGKNNLKITTSVENLNTSNATRFVWTPPISDASEVYDGGQDLIYIGPKPVKSYLRFKTEKIPKGGFELTKEDASGPLSGIEFTVTGEDFSHVYTTDSDGKIKVDNLELGTYHIAETKAPLEYYVDYQQDFELKTDNQIVKLNNDQPIINELFLQRVKIHKFGNVDPNLSDEPIDLADAEFTIYSDNQPIGTLDDNDVAVDHLITDSNGNASSKLLAIGDYLVAEDVAPIGYVLSSEVYPFTIANDGSSQNSTVETIEVSNQIITGQFELQKIGQGPCTNSYQQVCDTPLGDVTFAIYSDVNHNQIVDREESKPIQLMTTDSDGYALSKPLLYGDYIVSEVDNPNTDYIIDENDYPFAISQNQEIINLGQPVINTLKTGQLVINKSGEGFENEEIIPLANAEFSLYDSNDNLVTVGVTDKTGQLKIDNLEYGQYKLVESKAPNGYLISPESFEFEVSDDSPVVSVDYLDQVITNQISISKTDIDTGNEIPGAEMSVKNTDDNLIVDEWTSTTEPHQITSKFGNYEICEQTAPAGYRPKTDCLDYAVTTDGVNQHFDFPNKRMKMAVTGLSNPQLVVKIIIIILMVGLIKIYLKINHRRQQATHNIMH